VTERKMTTKRYKLPLHALQPRSIHSSSSSSNSSSSTATGCQPIPVNKYIYIYLVLIGRTPKQMQVVRNLSGDIHMEFGLDKCEKLYSREEN